MATYTHCNSDLNDLRDNPYKEQGFDSRCIEMTLGDIHGPDRSSYLVINL